MKTSLIKLHIAVLLAGFTGIFGKLIHLDEFAFVWYRMMIASIVLILILLFSKSFKKIQFHDFKKLFFIGAMIALHWVFFYGSIIKSNISIGVICFSTVGFFSAILNPIISKKRFSFREVVLSAIALFGVALIFSFDSRYRLGILYGIISAILAALFTIFNKNWRGITTTTNVLFYEMFSGFITLSALMPFYLLIMPASALIPTSVDMGWMFILASICTIVPYIFQIDALKDLSSFTVNLTFNLEPVYSVILAFTLFGEANELNLSFYVGVAMIVLSVLFQTYLQSNNKNA